MFKLPASVASLNIEPAPAGGREVATGVVSNANGTCGRDKKEI